MLNREVGLLGARSAVELLAAAQRSSRAILLIVDGYNECRPDRQDALSRALVALRRRYACAVVVTSRTALARADLLSLRPVEVLPPSIQVKRSIASEAIGGQPL